MDVRSQVIEIITTKCNIEQIDDNDDLVSLGLDSLDIVEAVLEIEDTFNVEFSSEEIAEIKTLKQLLELIDKKIN